MLHFTRQNRGYEISANSLIWEGSGLPCGLPSLHPMEQTAVSPGSSPVTLQLFSSLFIWESRQEWPHLIFCPLVSAGAYSQCCSVRLNPVRVTPRQMKYILFTFCLFLKAVFPSLFLKQTMTRASFGPSRSGCNSSDLNKFSNHYPRCEFGPLSLIKAPLCSQ